ncbi:MAG: hypothetical protein M3Q51_00365 [Pseudomonadota bacterium]|nr:hypothetical protein [Pseudomonadota bacterium]
MNLRTFTIERFGRLPSWAGGGRCTRVRPCDVLDMLAECRKARRLTWAAEGYPIWRERAMQRVSLPGAQT